MLIGPRRQGDVYGVLRLLLLALFVTLPNTFLLLLLLLLLFVFVFVFLLLQPLLLLLQLLNSFAPRDTRVTPRLKQPTETKGVLRQMHGARLRAELGKRGGHAGVSLPGWQQDESE